MKLPGGWRISFSLFTLCLQVLGQVGLLDDLHSDELPPPAYSFCFLIYRIDFDSVHFVVNVFESSGTFNQVFSDFDGFRSYFHSKEWDY